MSVTTNSRMQTIGLSQDTSDGYTSGTQQTIYTCPANCRAHISLLFVSSVDHNVTVDVEWNRANGDHFHILGGKNLSAGEFIQQDGAIIIFEPGDHIDIVSTGTHAHVDVFVTVEEFFVVPG